MRGLLTISNGIDAGLGAIARVFGWCFLILMTVIVFDIVTRKIGFQLSIFGLDLGSTRLQELEWHLHAFLYLTWIAFCYVRNAHVRIDVFTSGLSPRRHAWLELLGCAIFAAPYLVVALPHSWAFFLQSFGQNESSAAPNGLPWRWIVKFFLFFGFASVFVAVVSVALRRIVFLFGPPRLAAEAMPAAAGQAH